MLRHPDLLEYIVFRCSIVFLLQDIFLGGVPCLCLLCAIGQDLECEGFRLVRRRLLRCCGVVYAECFVEQPVGVFYEIIESFSVWFISRKGYFQTIFHLTCVAKLFFFCGADIKECKGITKNINGITMINYME